MSIKLKTTSNGSVSLTPEDTASDVVLTVPAGDGELFSQANILGTVSQSGGVPTGAIIERGSNANGEYVKYADGTQMCWIKGTLVDHTNSLSSASRLAGNWGYPIAFVDAANTSVQLTLPVHTSVNFVGCSRTDIISWGPSTGTATAVSISVFFTAGSVSTSNARIENMTALAVGRWY